jgi:hypothetical protein
MNHGIGLDSNVVMAYGFGYLQGQCPSVSPCKDDGPTATLKLILIKEWTNMSDWNTISFDLLNHRIIQKRLWFKSRRPWPWLNVDYWLPKRQLLSCDSCIVNTKLKEDVLMRASGEGETVQLHVRHWVTLIFPNLNLRNPKTLLRNCYSNDCYSNFIPKSLWPINQPNSDTWI